MSYLNAPKDIYQENMKMKHLSNVQMCIVTKNLKVKGDAVIMKQPFMIQILKDLSVPTVMKDLLMIPV
jgi:hypothetical protein